MTSRTYESGKNNCIEVLEILDPDATGYIDIEEMKPLVAKLPQELQDPVSELLRNYVFESHSFRISCDQFFQLYMNKLEIKDSFASTPLRRKSLVDSFFRSSTSSFWPSRSTTIHEIQKKPKRLRSFSPKKLNSYKELYQRKKSVESETWKKSTKLFDKIDNKVQNFNIFTEKNANFSIDKSSNRDYKFKYSNINELVKIRQKHLALCNKYQK
ncbi:hypothetical protein SteCoe_25056 [Stentor coeruleus]|uniref:EF-hand domain-containing protein n=1 Tax=Stentor coeruleus TaxID=5963 RepID=A0A1R2BG73_9CILI|nr:hypothetical protein SteCoe_25056 [Stentor coeruleus]